jgi:hypothetical protein
MSSIVRVVSPQIDGWTPLGGALSGWRPGEREPAEGIEGSDSEVDVDVDPSS